jgi:hypothetical protein
MLSQRIGLAAVALALCTSLVGCAAPRLCSGITSRGDEVKFLYYEGGNTGVIKCKMGGDGALSDCHPMTVELQP